MFTGIVREQLTIINTTATDHGLTLQLTLPQWGTIERGESILIHGICSTVTEIGSDQFTVYYIPETRRCTTVDNWIVGHTVHAEPSATPMTRLSGSIVFGHVDVALAVQSVHPFTLTIPNDYRSYIFKKGTITVNGVNLTIVDFRDSQITIEFIPETINRTSLAQLTVGQLVNVEFDYLAKAVTAALVARPL